MNSPAPNHRSGIIGRILTAHFNVRPAWIILVEHDLKGRNYRRFYLISRTAAVASVLLCLALLPVLHSDPEFYLKLASTICSISLLALSMWTTFKTRLKHGELALQTPVGSWSFFLHGMVSGFAPVVLVLILLLVPIVLVPASTGNTLADGLNYWTMIASMAMLGASLAMLATMPRKFNVPPIGREIDKRRPHSLFYTEVAFVLFLLCCLY